MNEKVSEVPLSKLVAFPDHPFAVRDDAAMEDMAESVRQNGVIVPGIVRALPNGKYELVSGHRRKRACELAGLKSMPVIVKELDRDAATILMVDSNLQRETILPSERAKAYKMKLEALKRQGARTDLAGAKNQTAEAQKPSISTGSGTSVQIGQKLNGKTSREVLATDSAESPSQIRRFIRLTELTPKLQQMVDEKRLGFTPAVEVSYLKPDEQELLLDAMESEQAVPSLSQAQRIKKLSQDGKLTDDAMRQVMREQKKPDCWDVTLSGQKLQRYFPKSFTPRQIESAIFKMLESLYQKRQQTKGQSR